MKILDSIPPAPSVLGKMAIALGLTTLLGTIAAACPIPNGSNPTVPSGTGSVPPPSTRRLAPLSKVALQQQVTAFQQSVQSDLDLQGLGKITNLGVPISKDLEKFRQSWAAVNPAIAPFLGRWAKDWNLMPYDFMTIFPSTVSGQVCIVRYRQTETETVPFQTITTPLEFSVAQVVDQQLLGSHFQSARSLLRRLSVTYVTVPYEAEFLGTLETNRDLRVYAAQNVPTVDTTWSPSLIQQLSQNHCTDKPM